MIYTIYRKEGCFTNATAIICEFNPIHNGHKYLIDRARALGAECVICIMSGNCVQRGEPAITDKYVRAETAVRSGADLVIELPFPYSCASAEFFASAGVRIAAGLGADKLCFGSECGDLNKLLRLSGTNSTAVGDFSVGAAKQWANSLGLENRPNDLLGVAYLSAISKYAPELKPLCIKRIGADYNSTDCSAELPSASAIREAILGGQPFAEYLPDGVADILKSAEANGRFPIRGEIFGRLLLLLLRTTDAESASLCAECGGGVAQRLISAALNSPDYAAFQTSAATKRYTNARLRRAAIFALTGVLPSDIISAPAYATLLAANKTGCEFLSETRKTRTLDIVTKPADIPVGADAEKQRRLSDNFDRLFTLALPQPQKAGFFTALSPKIFENG